MSGITKYANSQEWFLANRYFHNEILEELRNSGDEVTIGSVYIKIQLNFAVSDSMIEKMINKYADANFIKINEDQKTLRATDER